MTTSKKFISKLNQYIKSNKIPSCTNCKNFIPQPKKCFLPRTLHENADSYSRHGRCKLFLERDVITNKIGYAYSYSARQYEDNCGIIGRFFTPKSSTLL